MFWCFTAAVGRMRSPSPAHVCEHWFLAGGTVVGGCGTYKGWHFHAKGSQSLKTGHEVCVAWPYSLSAPGFLFCQTKHVVRDPSCKLRLPSSILPPCLPASCCHAFLHNELDLGTMSQGKPCLPCIASHQFTAVRKATNTPGDWHSPAVTMET